MRLTHQKRMELARSIQQLRQLQQNLHDSMAYNDYEKSEEWHDKISVAHSFLIGELTVLINEPDPPK